MAKDRPSPYGNCKGTDGEGNPLACACGIRGPSPYGEGEAASTPVARGPVPRDRCMARNCPSPYGEKRSALSVARGPVPRDRCMARDRPSPYGNCKGTDGEGQALALR